MGVGEGRVLAKIRRDKLVELLLEAGDVLGSQVGLGLFPRVDECVVIRLEQVGQDDKAIELMSQLVVGILADGWELDGGLES